MPGWRECCQAASRDGLAQDALPAANAAGHLTGRPWPGGVCGRPVCSVAATLADSPGAVGTRVYPSALTCENNLFLKITCIHEWGWTGTMHPDGTATMTSPDRTRQYDSHALPAAAT